MSDHGTEADIVRADFPLSARPCKQAVAHGRHTKLAFEKTCAFVGEIIRDLHHSVGVSDGTEK
jgi:hypothetical protein